MSDLRTQRHMAILRYLPEQPNSTTTTELKIRLETDGFNVSLRTLQRDIESLCCHYPISCDESVRPHRWFCIKGVTDTSIGMTPSSALAMQMLKEQSNYLLPQQVLENLNVFFAQAERKLSGSQSNPLLRWPSRIANLAPGFQLHPPKLNNAILQTVEDALIHQRVLELDYQARPPRQAKTYQVNPLALVIRGSVYYLVATLTDIQEFRHFALHRTRQANIIEQASVNPPDFDLSDYIARGSLSFPKQEMIVLKLKVNAIEGYHLLETPLSPDQTVSYPAGDLQHFIIEAQVNQTEELRWWLMSISDISEVISPISLRKEVAASLKKALQQYDGC